MISIVYLMSNWSILWVDIDTNRRGYTTKCFVSTVTQRYTREGEVKNSGIQRHCNEK